METHLNILMLEDLETDSRVALEQLHADGLQFEARRVENEQDFRRELHEFEPDLILADYSMPGYDGLSALNLARTECASVPFVFVSGTMGEDVVVDALQRGATDYVLKQRLDRLVPAVRRALDEAEQRSRRETAEKDLQLVRAALEASANAILITDVAGRIQWANEAFCKLTGYSQEEVKGLNPRVLRSGKQPDSLYADLWNTILSGQVWQGQLINRRKNGSHYLEWTTITPIRNTGGKITHFIAVKEDITTQNTVQQALQESENRFHTVFDLAPDGIFLTEVNGRFTDANKACTTLFGLSRAELIGSLLTDLKMASPAEIEKAHLFLTKGAQGEPSGPTELQIVGTKGAKIPLEMRTFPVVLGKRALILWVARDITDRKRLESQFLQSQKMDAIGHLAGGIAHDFNNLLAVMRGYAELLLMQPEKLTPGARDGLHQIVQAGDRAANLTRQLLVFSRKEAVQLKPQSLNVIASNLTKMLQRIIGEHIKLTCRFDEALPWTDVDTGMIEQVLVNLVINARDAMPHGGSLVIETSGENLDEAQARLIPNARPGEYSCLSVRDTGSGIDPANLSRIFEPFFTTKAPGKGTGLGLATVYGIISQHHGWVNVLSQLGAGTVFKVFLPAVRKTPLDLPQVAAEQKASAGTETILLVEDEAAVRAVSRRVLENSGYHVLEARSGPEAIKVWEAHCDTISLLLTDVIMPEGMTGIELSELLMARRPQLRTVFISGYSADVVDKDTALVRRNSGRLISKPFPAQALLQAVRNSLDE